MNWRAMSVMLPAIISLSMVAACSQGQEPQKSAKAPEVKPAVEGEKMAPDGKSLVEQRCAKCHTTDRIYDRKHSREEWERVVGLMIAKGAQLDDAERKAVIDHLSSQ